MKIIADKKETKLPKEDKRKIILSTAEIKEFKKAVQKFYGV